MRASRIRPRWAVQCARRLGLDRNPLRRRIDRVETWTRIGLILAFLVLAPLLAVGVSRWTGTALADNAQSQLKTGRQVTATLVQDVSASSRTAFGYTTATARWTAPDGTARTGEVQAPLGARAGSTVKIWTDQRGNLAGRPMSGSERASRSAAAATIAVAGLALLFAICLKLVNRTLDRHRARDWEADWSTVEPLWTRRRR